MKTTNNSQFYSASKNVQSGAETAGAVVGLVSAVRSIIGGGKEPGHGKTKPDTLAHAIDKLDKANDLEALDLASKAVTMRLQGKTEREVELYIDTSLGYPANADDNDGKVWNYIRRMLRKETEQARQQLSMQANSNGQFQTAGFGGTTAQYAMLGAGGLAIITTIILINRD